MSLTDKAEKQRARKTLSLLEREYPDATCTLDFTNPLELLVATILSAQCTDERVNALTPELFRKYSNCAAYLKVAPEELEQDIRPTGFYRNKARAIQGACRLMVEKHGGLVPDNLEALLELPGVARKTANVVLGNAFGVAVGIAVDTHVARVSQRLGLTSEQQPEKIERDLMQLVPRARWTSFSHLLIAHGRKVCKARRPLCEECVVERLCPSSLLKNGA